MAQNIPWNISGTIKNPIQANGETLVCKVANVRRYVCANVEQYFDRKI